LTPKSRHPRDGDQVTIDYTVQEDETNIEEPVVDAVFVVGESGLLGPVEDAIKGLRVGEATGFSVLFAEDDESVDESLRGKTLAYSVALKGLKERDLLPLDDDFAKTVGDVDTIEELRREIAEDMHVQRTNSARSEALAQILEKISEGATVEIPAPMIDRAVEDDVRRLRERMAQQGTPLEAYFRATGETEQQLRDDMRPAATERLRTSLLMRTIAEKEEIAVSDEVIDEAVERMLGAARETDRAQQAEKFARSEYVRDLLESEYFHRELTNRLIELATEGRGAVINGWEPPAASATETTDAGDEAPSETGAEDNDGSESSAEPE
jgi:trigger factor